MRLRVLALSVCLVLVSGVWAGGPERVAPHVVNDLAALQGTWQIVGCEFGGRTIPKEQWAVLSWTFRQERLTLNTKSPSVTEYRVELDLAQRPARMVMQLNRPGGPTAVLPAIYRVQGDTLQVCLAGNGPRPERFEAKPGGKGTLYTFQRVRNVSPPVDHTLVMEP
jgi:uncharacterized protein (TIGR03067 family)